MRKMRLENKYVYKTKDLLNLLGVTRMTIYNWEQDGRFKPPRNINGARVFTEEQLGKILEAFSPGGKGYWHFSP